MSTLWHKGYHIDERIKEFTVGDDPIFDTILIPYDCLGSIAHAQMLMTIGILSAQEFNAIKMVLREIMDKAKQNKFSITIEDEDVHTAVENYLVAALGDVGKKIHTARSRNDQIALDVRLYMKDQLLLLCAGCLQLASMLCALADKHEFVPMAGRTHFQKAMPSSIGLWLGAYLESMLDNCMIIQHTYTCIDQCPLGSASGFGVNLPIDRQLVSNLLGFSKVQNNVLYVANSRGKFESLVLEAAVSIMIDLSKLSTDLIVFSAPEFDYVTLPDNMCTGSSLMPQKKNPDVLELVRAKSSQVISNLLQTIEIIKGLPSGYNRDLQETKKPLIEGLATAYDSLLIITHVIDNLSINLQACLASCTPEIFATDKVLECVKKGMPFRDAYAKIALTDNIMSDFDAVANIQTKAHQGAPGCLNLAANKICIHEYHNWVQEQQHNIEQIFLTLGDIL